MSGEKYIARSWRGYKDMVVPKNAGPNQIAETRQAFFSGAAILFQALMTTMDKGEEPTMNDLQKMADIQKELDEFGQELDLRLLKTSMRH